MLMEHEGVRTRLSKIIKGNPQHGRHELVEPQAMSGMLLFRTE